MAGQFLSEHVAVKQVEGKTFRPRRSSPVTIQEPITIIYYSITENCIRRVLASKSTEFLTIEDEENRSQVLNPDTPQGLLNCVVFLNGKNFCLRVGQEHNEAQPVKERSCVSSRINEGVLHLY